MYIFERVDSTVTWSLGYLSRIQLSRGHFPQDIFVQFSFKYDLVVSSVIQNFKFKISRYGNWQVQKFQVAVQSVRDITDPALVGHLLTMRNLSNWCSQAQDW